MGTSGRSRQLNPVRYEELPGNCQAFNRHNPREIVRDVLCSLLDTSVLQIPAQRLYEKNGFREVGRDRYQDLDVILYEKQLS